MKKNGFTLLELLAVIVVLAIIALIVTPFVTKAIDEAKKGAALNSANGLIKVAEVYYAQKLTSSLGNFTEEILTFSNGTITKNGETFTSFKYKGTKIESAYIEINEKGKIRMYAYHDGYCAKKEIEEKDLTITKVEKNDCALDTLKQPEITGGSSEWTTSRTIRVTELPESGSELSYYEYYVSTSSTSTTGGEWIRVEGTEIRIEEEGEHYVYIRGVDTEGKHGDVSSPEQVKIDLTDYTITVPGSITGGTITSDKATAKIGEIVTLTITPSETYILDTLTKDGSNIKGTTTFTMGRSNTTIGGSFKKNVFNIALTQSTGGTISAISSQTVDEEVTITTTPSIGYRLKTLKVGNTDITTTKKFTMPNSAVTVTVVWEKIPYVVTLTQSTGGTLSAVSKATAGEEVTVTATPDENYILSSLVVKDASNNTVTVTNNKFTMPSSGVTISPV